MQRHTKIYLSSLKYDVTDFIPSEISGAKAVDIHHIIGRGKCGEDRIENLMALTRKEHIDYGDNKLYMVHLLKIHRSYLCNMGVVYSDKWFEDKIRMYED